MEPIPNPSSEAELLELRNQGKISEAEYNDLLAAMRTSRTSSPADGEAAVCITDNPGTKCILGKIALCLMLAGVVLPFLSYFALALGGGPNANADTVQLAFYTGLVCEITAFVLGLISRRDPYGRAAMISAAVLAGLLIIIFALTVA